MPTVQILRKQAADLGIQGRSTMRRAELLAAIASARARLEATASSSPGRTTPPPEVVEPVEPAAAPPERRHRHSGAGPLLPPLALRPLPTSYDLTHLAILPRNPREIVVFWAIEPRSFPDGGATLELWSNGERVGTAPVDHVLGRWYFGGLADDRALSARIVRDGHVLVSAGVVMLPPDGPSGLHHPVVATIMPDRPLATLPRDLRGAAGPAPLASGATASERAWAAATDGSAAPGVVRVTEQAAHFSRVRHERLVSSLEHAVREATGPADDARSVEAR